MSQSVPVADSKDNTVEDHSMRRCSSWHSQLGNNIGGSLRRGKGFAGSIVAVAIGCIRMCKGRVVVRLRVRLESWLKVGVEFSWEINRQECESKCRCWAFMFGH